MSNQRGQWHPAKRFHLLFWLFCLSLASPGHTTIIVSEGGCGPIETRALLWNSSAIDTGNDADCTDIDQRGETRIRCDAGAFEFIADSSVELEVVLDTPQTARVTGTQSLKGYIAPATNVLTSPLGSRAIQSIHIQD